MIFWDQHQHGRIDFAWFRKGRRIPHVVFEIEGIDVQKPSLREDLHKFRWSRATHKVIFLYSERVGFPLMANTQLAARKVQKRITEIQQGGNRAQQVTVIAVTREP
ncbi:hypothetical protein ACPWT1_02950 [Ramlibacter sp. MMS24-I3-19]|uniref:hypothetical protein n=1 Tax=Ramlibacter sp. MMS24-I3-19 TaxID=3416606 RepID=UPI003CFC183D